MKNDPKLALSLFLLRISVFVVMLLWTIDKFVRPDHAAKVYELFYHIPSLGAGIMTLIAIVELIIIIGFLFGIWKPFSYGAVLLFHAISTFSSFKQYAAPFEDGNLLFFAAWPMLAACLALFLLRDRDSLMTIK